MARAELVVETRARGLWRLRAVSVAARVLPRRLRLPVARWAVRGVRVDLRTGGRPWRRHDPGFDLEVS